MIFFLLFLVYFWVYEKLGLLFYRYIRMCDNICRDANSEQKYFANQFQSACF
jgi:membrane-anchored glycerophosphoryl diester phosphodiesterase (GDPDase)